MQRTIPRPTGWAIRRLVGGLALLGWLWGGAAQVLSVAAQTRPSLSGLQNQVNMLQCETGTGGPIHYRDNGDGTITDCFTGLMWEKKSNDGSVHDVDNLYSWSAGGGGFTAPDGTAFTVFLATLNSNSTDDPSMVGFAGYTDWRIPTIVELQTIIDFSHFNPVVDPIFNAGCTPGCTVMSCSCTAAFVHWSSSSHASTPILAWFVRFDSGFDGVSIKNNTFHVRAVRGGR